MAADDEGKGPPSHTLPDKANTTNTPSDEPDPVSDHTKSVTDLIRRQFGIGR